MQLKLKTYSSLYPLLKVKWIVTLPPFVNVTKFLPTFVKVARYFLLLNSNSSSFNYQFSLKSNQYFLSPTKAFTLVELIVVITILAILSTIWFVSYTWFMSTARDSNRLTQLEWIHNGLETYKTKGKLPLPDDSITIYASWVTNIVWYQWNAWETVLNKIWYQKWWKDPLDDKYYTYYTDKKQQNIELLWFLENDPWASKEITSIMNSEKWIMNNYWLLTKVNATDYTERIITTFWKKLWILLDTNNNPIQENTTFRSNWFDVVTQTWSYKAVFIWWTWTSSWIVIWTWVVLNIISNPNKSCLTIRQSLIWRTSWYYTINPTWLQNIEVYCDMVMDWGWWTLVWRSVTWAVWSFWWSSQLWTPSNENIPYSMWSVSQYLNFNNLLIARYETWKNISLSVKVQVNNSFSSVATSWIWTSNWTVITTTWLLATEVPWNHLQMTCYRWYTSDNTSFFLRDMSPWPGYWLYPHWFSMAWYNSTYWAFSWKQWMIFVR